MKKEYKKTKNPRLSDYSKYADLLFKELSENQDILKIEPDELKLSLYENCVKVVDCLSEKYNRTTKFEYKERLYDAIAKTATLLNNKEKANQANHEKTKFTNARENALYHVSDYHKAKNDRKFQKRNDWENS